MTYRSKMCLVLATAILNQLPHLRTKQRIEELAERLQQADGDGWHVCASDLGLRPGQGRAAPV